MPSDATGRSLTQFGIVFLVALCACEPASARERKPTTRLQSNAACIGCHPAQARQWAGSLHNHAWTDGSFAHAYRNEPSPFCWGCHAPEADGAPKGAAARSGVACVSCHVGDEAAGVRPSIDHPVLSRSAERCGRCHEFGFESNPTLLMQATVTEHRGSAHADVRCSSCHMADGNHAFGITRDPVRLGAALEARAERDGDTVRLRLRSRGVGHAFPTGDTFRSLHVEVGREGGPTSAEARLQRNFAMERARSGLGFALEELADTRLGADGSETTLELRVPASRTERLWWSVVYERSDNPFKSDPKTFERIELARGDLEAEARR